MTHSGADQMTKPAPAWERSDDELLSTINRVRAGRSLKPDAWPGGARVAVAFSLDVDNETPILAADTDEGMFAGLGVGSSTLEWSLREYGARRGIVSLTEIFDRHGVPATYFMPAVSLMAAPEMAEVIKRAGHHEIALHGWVHEEAAKLETAEIEALLRRSADYLERAFGQRPVGFRAPLVIQEHTFPALLNMGLLYDSSLLSDDVPFEVNLNGKPSGLIEIPPNFSLEDGQTDQLFNWFNNAHAPNDVLDIFRSEFDVAYREGGLVVLVFHPHIMGQRSRAAVVDRLIEHMKTRDDVWFATHREVAEFVQQEFSM